MARGELNIRLGLDSSGLRRGLRNAETELQKSVRKMGQLGQSLSISVTAPLAGIATAAVGAFAQFEKLEKGLTAVSGSADEANKELARLREVAKLPGLALPELTQGSIRLQAVGLSADEARKSLKVFGTAIAATGGGAENLERVTYQLTQMISKNRILQEDFGIIQENIPLIGKALEIAFKTSNIEAIRETGVSAQEFNARLVDALATLPELQGNLGSVSNSWENLKDAIGAALIEVGRSISETFNLQAVFDTLGDAINAAAINFKNLDENTKNTIIRIVAIVAAIGPAITAVYALRVAITVLGSSVVAVAGSIRTAISGIAKIILTLTSPWAIVVGVIIGGFIALYNQSEDFRNTMKALVNVVNQVAIESARVFKGIGAAIKLALTGPGGIPAAAEVLKATFSSDAGSGIGAAWARGFEDGISDVSLQPIKDKINEVKNSIKAFFTLPDLGTGGDGGGDGGGGGTGGGLGAGLAQSLPTFDIEAIEPLKLFRTELESLGEVQIRNIEYAKKTSSVYTSLGSILSATASAVTSAANSGEASFRKLGQAALKAAADVARAALIEVVTTALADSFKKLGILALPLAAGIGALAGGVFNSILKGLRIPALAQGGLAYSPTLALVGDNRGAGADPEVIAPLSKLKQYLGGGNQLIGNFRVAGRDLELVLERSQADSQRISPF